MKIIQSYWSKPYDRVHNGFYGGWYSKTFHYMSCALSCLKLSEFYPVELITDKKGKRLLVDEIGLPYTFVSDDLEYIDYPEDLWAAGKIVAYSKQNEPFIHVDNDILIWNRFPANLINRDLIAQSKEENYNYYKDLYDDITHHFVYIPKQILEYQKKNPQQHKAVNAGLLGGNDIGFFKEYSRTAFIFIEKNLNKLNMLNVPSSFNLFFEQYLFYCMAQNAEERICYYFDTKIDEEYKILVNFWNVPNNCNFIHPLASFKRYYIIGEQITQRLWFEYPEYYTRIHELIEQNKI